MSIIVQYLKLAMYHKKDIVTDFIWDILWNYKLNCRQVTKMSHISKVFKYFK